MTVRRRSSLSEWVPPHEFDEYRLIRRLGHGAMGQVWLGRDTALERLVAIKFIRFDDDSELVRERFLIEARAAARIQHPNVLAVHRVGMTLGHPYTVTELLEGRSLDSFELPLEQDRVLEFGVQVARGLSAAHGRGVLHRDLKPANTFVTVAGEVKILDFGLAKLSPVDVLPTLHEARARGKSGVTKVRRVRHGQSPTRGADTLGSTMDLSAECSFEGTPSSARAGSWRSLVGTPSYMAPECWGRSSATPAIDVYALGALLYELCAGKPPPAYLPPGPIREMIHAHGIRKLSEVAPHIDAGLASVIERCLAPDPALRYVSGAAVCEALEALVPARVGRGSRESNPYRGLLAFEAEHRAWFFGREAEARAVVERLKGSGCVVVVADSGAGKSSLCRAAVLPLCVEGALGEGRSWTSATLVPGSRPLAALAEALGAALDVEESVVAQGIRNDPEGLPSLARRALGPARGLVLFVDQLEELTMTDTPEDVRTTFIEALLALCSRRPGIRVLASIRSDLLGRFAMLHPRMSALLSPNLFLLAPPSSQALRDVVTGPARLHGFSFESEHTVELLVAFGGRPGALPLLQFALTEIWGIRDAATRLLPRAALEKLGGAEGALARHADQVLARLSPCAASAARDILLHLVSEDETRRRRSREELIHDDPNRRAALEALSHERLVVARGGPGGEGYELAHEALLTAWPKLRDWLDDDAGARALRERVERAAAEWERLGERPEALWGRTQLAELEKLSPWTPPPPVKRFLRASRRRQRRERFRAPALVAALAFVSAAAWGGSAFHHRQQLYRQIAERLSAGDEAARETHELEAEWHTARADAYRAFDRGDWNAGEARWARAREKEAVVTGAASRATAAYESAVLLDASRVDTRRRLAHWWIERALSADDAGDPARRDELLARASRLDGREAGAARLREPAHVTLTVDPPFARAQIARYTLENARYVLGPARAFREGTFEPGSYLLELTATERAPVRLPILMGRGESRAITVRLLPKNAVPEGFIHIPRGRFLFGAAGDDELRRTFFEAAPIHPVETGEYLIAQHEITFGEYLDFVRALPPSERAARLPRGASLRAEDQEITLVERKEGFELSLRIIGPGYRAREHEPLVYSTRQVRSVQAWKKLPATAITAEDVEAYARWLDRSGKVPGARLCTEVEWERAARGADSRMYPHAERLLPEDANYDETYRHVEGAVGPDEVGSHPSSDSPFGVADLAGNAWEVVRTSRADSGLVARGGSFFVNQLTVRSVNQWAVMPTLRSVENGGRICADALR